MCRPVLSAIYRTSDSLDGSKVFLGVIPIEKVQQLVDLNPTLVDTLQVYQGIVLVPLQF